MPATLTDAGLQVQTLEEVLAEVRAEALDPVTGFGPLHDVTSATSPVAVLIGLAARREAVYQSLLSSLTSALFPAGAAGTMLDRQLTITGATSRIEDSHSTISVQLSGDPGIDVSNKYIRYKPTGTLWRTPGLTVLDGGGLVVTTARAEEPGPVDAPASTDWEVVSTTDGWDAVASVDDAELGEFEEDDPTVRDRLTLTDSVGRGTEPAIYARLYEVPGVTSVVVDNNRGLAPNVNGVPGKTVESLVIGGEDEVIAEVLHETYECDSGSFGNTTVTFTNRFDKEITIQFSRVDELQMFAEVNLTTTGAEVPLPSDYEAQVRAAVGARALLLKPGQNLTSAWFVGAIVAALPIGSVVDVEILFSPDEGGPFFSWWPVTSRQVGILQAGATPATATSLQRPEGFDVTAGWHLDLEIDGAPVSVVFAGGAALTGAQIAAEVTAALVAADSAAAASGSLNRLRITTSETGSTHSIEVVNTSTAGLLAELGGDFAVAGTLTGADFAVVDVNTL